MLQVSEKTVRTEVLVNCSRCHELFTLNAILSGNRILKLDSHSHIKSRDEVQHNGTRCHCGGELKFYFTQSFCLS